MAQITMRVSDEVYKKLQSDAEQNNLTLTDYLLSKAMPDYLEEVLTVDKVLNRLRLKKKNETFSLKDLFLAEEWGNFTPGSRISTGRLFFQAYGKSEFKLKKRVEFVRKNSANLAIYKKLTDD